METEDFGVLDAAGGGCALRPSDKRQLAKVLSRLYAPYLQHSIHELRASVVHLHPALLQEVHVRRG